MPAFHVETAVTINVPRSQVHAAVVDFHTWPIWSPWLYVERETVVNYHGSPGETGHGYQWQGSKVGEGGMSLQRSNDQHIECKLNFVKPFKSTARVTFDLVEVEKNQTKVIWSMHSALPFFMFFMIDSMSSMIHADYNRGLAMLKDYMELDSVPSRTTLTGPVDVQTLSYLGYRAESQMAELASSMALSIPALHKNAQELNLEVNGSSFVIYNKMNLKNAFCTYTAALPIVPNSPSVQLPLLIDQLPECKAFQVVHVGPYRHLPNAWSTIVAEMKHQKIKPSKKLPPFERYLNNPDTIQEDELVT